MDQQKKIEEMAKDMLEYGMEKYPTGDSVFTETILREQFYHVFLTYAECLINKGYRKIDENAVVLTREEYKKLQKHYLFMKDYTVVEVLENETKKASKETAEKFAERLKSDVSEDNELHEALNAYLKRDYFEYIDERCNQIMEGVDNGK